jgi:Uma2 family endonuclease
MLVVNQLKQTGEPVVFASGMIWMDSVSPGLRAGGGLKPRSGAIVMSTITSTPMVPAPTPPPSELYRFTVDEYERVVAGAVHDPNKVELVDGYVVRKMAKSPEHGFTTKELLCVLDGLLPPGWTTRKEEPVRIPDYDEPEPDVAVARGSNADYRHRLPGGADTALVVEVSVSTLVLDRGKKLDAYRAGRVPIYWIVNLVDRQVEVYTSPGPAGYAARQDFLPGQQVPVVIDGQQLGHVAVDDILP